MPCTLSIRSDPGLLEQMIRNLISNALKYTKRGRVLVGCRRRLGKLRIEIWDTGLATARPSDPGALAARKGVCILDRGPTDAGRRPLAA